MEFQLLNSVKTSIIDKNINCNDRFKYKFLINSDEKIITSIRKYLEDCDEFIISVAFITQSGVTLLLEELRTLCKKGIKGKILTGDYLNFTQPKALEKLLEFENITLKIVENSKFHSKGYFFRKGNLWTIMIGSSNLTQSALTINTEWNLVINSLEEGEITYNIMNEFYKIFNSLPEITMDFLEKYSMKTINKEKSDLNTTTFLSKIEPNFMQKQALENLKSLRLTENKGLLISATGTGKTYLSAFDVREFNCKKLLFITHRKTILNKSLESFKNIIPYKKMGIYDKKDEYDYTFAMIQTFGKEEHFSKYPQDYFDYIIIDEVHHSGAKMYQKIFDYFSPKFLLGMTATPERTDGYDIYKLFDNNIAYEIRLYDALREELLCPFHYFGISDIYIDGKEIDENTTISDLTTDERVRHILEKSDFYGYSGEFKRGLIFVSRAEEAKILAEKMNKLGIKVKALLGDSGDLEREKAINAMEKGELEFIITVDIFNEGVDIPCVNQIILLRPTQSSIVYIQQIGRGLRKYRDKEYLVILDFIGNYEKNFMVPVAISQDSNYSKEYLKKFLVSGTNIIPGESSISFEEIIKERIFENINNSNFSTKKNIERDFDILEQQLGRVPLLYDFFTRNMLEPSIILKYKKNYHEILRILRPKLELGKLDDDEINFLTFLSSFFTPAKRVHEMAILNEILKTIELDIDKFLIEFENRFKFKNQRLNILNACEHLAKEIFISLSTCKVYLPIIEKFGENYRISKKFYSSYQKNKYFKSLVDDLIKYNLGFVEKNYLQKNEKTIALHKSYSKQEAFWYLNLDFNNGYQVSGYTVFDEKKTAIIFLTLDNNYPYNEYDNKFFDKKTFNWFSKEQRYLERKNQLTNEGKIANNYYTIQVFLKRKSSENFYYLGEVEKIIDYQEKTIYNGRNRIEYIFQLKNELSKEIYEYMNGYFDNLQKKEN